MIDQDSRWYYDCGSTVIRIPYGEKCPVKTLSLKVPNSVAAKIIVLGRRRETTKSALVREALRDYLDGKRPPRAGSFVDLAGDLIGSLDSSVGDLASNPKHREAFGR